MTDREIDVALADSPTVDKALLERISRRIVPNLRAVRPLAARLLAVQLIAIAAAVAFAGASQIGFYAIHRLTDGQTAMIFPGLAILIWLAAAAATAAMIPGARQRLRPLPLMALACAALLAIFALIFRDYSTARFLRQGIACLKAGLMDALPAGLVAWLVLRRGFAVDSAAAGAATGALAGLAGVLMLELHCPIFKAPHVMVWHTAVIPVSGAVGWVMGKSRNLKTPRTSRSLALPKSRAGG
jgi:negative regulator of sigma F NrsF-like protein